MDGWSELMGDEGSDESVPQVPVVIDSSVIGKINLDEPEALEDTEPKLEQSEPKEEKKTEEIPSKDTKRPRFNKSVDRSKSVIKRLLYGGAGTGKTRAGLNYAYQLWKKDNNMVLWYIDTERGLKETLKEFPKEFDSAIECFECNNFKDVVGALDIVLKNSVPGDVTIVDMLTTVWEWAQSTYTMEVFDENMSNFYIARRRELELKSSGKGVFDGWKDWVGIKILHNQDFVDELVRQTGAEFIAICGAKEVEMNDVEKNKLVKNPTIFTPIGFAPEGEKHNDHRFDRIIYFTKGVNDWYMKAPKWRGNKDMLLKRVTIPEGEFPDV